MSAKDAFATRLRGLREMSGLSQGELADKLGVSRGSISFYENADRVADIEFLYNCSAFFGVELNYLLGLSDNAFPENQGSGMITGLSDKAIHKLKEGTIDKRLFNYMVEHNRFDDFMALLSDYSNGCYETLGRKRIDDIDYVTFLVTQVLLKIVTEISGTYSETTFSGNINQGRPYDIVLDDFMKTPGIQQVNIIKQFDEPDNKPIDKTNDEAIRRRVRNAIIGKIR